MIGAYIYNLIPPMERNNSEFLPIVERVSLLTDNFVWAELKAQNFNIKEFSI